MYKDLTGARFGRLVVLSLDGRKHRHLQWRCLCDCGNEVVVDGSNLVRKTRSCGCLAREKLDKYNSSIEARANLRSVIKRNTVHGLSKHPLHRKWSHMLERCEKDWHKSNKDYGGRGIKVCPEWHDFKAFYDWAIQNGWSEGLSLERVDCNEGYGPKNCKWIPFSQQSRNRRNVVLFNGKTFQQLSDETGISYGTLYWRYKNNKPLYEGHVREVVE